jgi:Baseplate J-like protein
MTEKPPILDSRTLPEILQQLQDLAKNDVPEWQPPPEGDAGTMLQRIYARLLELAIQRLNQVPEKNLLAFLDTMGVSLLPPSPATVPLTFSLTPGTPATLIPKGAQAGTQPSGQQPAVIFETADDLTVIPAQIVQALTIDPTWDRYIDQTDVLGGQSAIGFTPFVGTKRMPHILYLGDETLLNFSRAMIQLEFNFVPLAGFSNDKVWTFLQKLSYRYLAQGIIKSIDRDRIDLISGGSHQARFQLDISEPIDQETIQGIGLISDFQSRWLRLVLVTPFPDALVAQDLRLNHLKLKVSASGLLPDLAFSNTAPVDVTKDFSPFGEAPKAGDTFFIGSQEVFSKLAVPYASVTVKLDVEVKQPPPPTPIWEFFSNQTWVQFPRSSIDDRTASFTQSGTITLSLPTTGFTQNSLTSLAGVIAMESEIDSQASAAAPIVLVRVRVADGNYQGAPKINRFQLRTKLAEAVNPNQSTVRLIDTQFASTRNALLVGDEFVQVDSIASDTGTVYVGPPFLKLHNVETPVERRAISSQAVATLLSSVQQGTNQLTVSATEKFGSGDFLMIDDLLQDTTIVDLREFVTVQDVQPVQVSGDTSTFRISTAEPLRFGHIRGKILHRVTSDFFGVADGELVDFTKVNLVNPFFPFSTQPSPGDIFFIATTIGFLAKIEISVDLEIVPPNVELQWEFLGANKWKSIIPTADGTRKFLQSGDVEFKFLQQPQPIVAAQVNGQSNYWIRVRISNGNYGLPIEFESVDPTNPAKGFKVKPGTGNLNPPDITKLTLSYEAEGTPTVLTQNGFLYNNQTLENTATGFAPFVSVKDLPQIYADTEPSFYLGFDAAFPEQPVSLFIAVEPRAFAGSVVKETRSTPVPSSALPPLQWEYFNGTTWRNLTVFDDTNHLTESGAVEFLTPTDIAPLAKFDLTARYWIRARSPKNDPFDTQQLQGIFLNTIPATQAVTVQTEILGSSNGQPNQVLSFARTPILPGQQVLVREPEAPSDREREAIEAEEGKDAVQTRSNPITGEPEIWVRWHEMDNFVPSDLHSRHYTLDRPTGLLKFGDGKRGLIPPRDTNNIISVYRTGGGTVGNVPQAVVAQVKSPLPGIAAVTNPVAADGGAEVETVPMVEARGPQTLRHRDRAVTCSDFESLARQAVGTRVARTKCLSNINRDLRFEPGWVTLIIVPQGTEPKLLPSSELIRAVENYLEVRTFVGLVQQTPARVNVVGPGYIQVAVVAEVAPQDIDEAQQVKQRVVTALNAFFHPLVGGPNGTGWEFARDVYESEVSQVLEGVSGVDYVKFLELLPNIAQHRCGFASPTVAEIELPEGSPVIKTDRQKAALLAESVPLGTTVERIAIKGFKEGDRITKVLDLLNPTKSDPTVIDGISYPVITVTAFVSDAVGFPRGSLVTTFDGTRRTRLVRGIPRNATAQTEIVVEDDDFVARLQPDKKDVLVVFYPFPMTITAVTVGAIDLTVQSVSGNTIAVAAFNIDIHLPQGSLVTMVDRTQKTRLAQEILPNQTGITQIVVQDLSFAASLKPGDLLRIPLPLQTLGIEPYEPEVAFPPDSLLATLDNRVRLPLLTSVLVDPIAKTVTSIKLHDFISGDEVKVFRRDAPSQSQSLTIQDLEPIRDIVYLDDNFLVYPGAHRITMVSDPIVASKG